MQRLLANLIGIFCSENPIPHSVDFEGHSVGLKREIAFLQKVIDEGDEITRFKGIGFFLHPTG